MNNRGNNVEPKLVIDNIKVQKTEHYKFLGVHIDSKFDWAYHANYVIKKLKQSSQSSYIFNGRKHVFAIVF